jgi:hypothetical protein
MAQSAWPRRTTSLWRMLKEACRIGALVIGVDRESGRMQIIQLVGVSGQTGCASGPHLDLTIAPLASSQA